MNYVHARVLFDRKLNYIVRKEMRHKMYLFNSSVNVYRYIFILIGYEHIVKYSVMISSQLRRMFIPDDGKKYIYVYQ